MISIADWRLQNRETSHRFTQMNTDKAKAGLDCKNVQVLICVIRVNLWPSRSGRKALPN